MINMNMRFRDIALWSIQPVIILIAGCPVDQGGTIPTDEDATTIALQLMVEGLTSPVGMAAPPDDTGRLFLLDQVGQIRVVDAEGTLITLPFLDVSERMIEVMSGFDERGLLSLAFHPDYANNGRFFVVYNGPTAAEGFDSELRLAEFQVSSDDPDVADPDSERVLLAIDKPQFNHNGGQIAFGPDGFLYISVGDGGGANDTANGHTPDLGNGQDKTTMLGKVLRIDVDSGDPFGIPADNPFIGDENALPEIWALGLRNPWRFSFDTAGARRLLLADVGQDLFEEVNIIESGGNYGWNVKEATRCFDSPSSDCQNVDADGQLFIDPIIEYPHDAVSSEPQGVAVIGGFVYRGVAIPDLQGQYLFGDWSRSGGPDGSIFSASESDTGAWTLSEVVVSDGANGRFGRYILAFGQDADGELYVLSTENAGPSGTTGQVHKIVPVE